MSYRLGVDVGGTFTDLLLINEENGETFTAKVLSTPEDSSIGVLNGVSRICDESDVDPEMITRVMHGTTVATNAVLTERGAMVGSSDHQRLQTYTASGALFLPWWPGRLGQLCKKTSIGKA